MRTNATESRAVVPDNHLHLGADKVRWVVLATVFGGDPHAWVDYLLEKGSRRQLEEDLPFAIRLAMRDCNDVD